jgi:hypothetical protein
MPTGVSVLGSQRLATDRDRTHTLFIVSIEPLEGNVPYQVGFLYSMLVIDAPQPFESVVDTRVLYRPGVYFGLPRATLNPGVHSHWEFWADWNVAGLEWFATTFYD